MPLKEGNTKEAFADRFNVSRETLSKFEQYHELLLMWGKKINLIGKTTIDDFWNRHILDSAQILEYIKPSDNSIIDLGSGAGFPGLVVAKLISETNTNALVTLVDSSVKRCAFLREAARVLDVKVNVENKKVEEIESSHYDILTARAFTALDNLLNYSSSFAQINTRMLFLKGSEVDKEIKDAQKNWLFDYTIHPSISDDRGCVIEISNLTDNQLSN